MPNPKNIKDVYVFVLPEFTSIFDELLIAKDGDDFITWGKAKNLTRPNKTYDDYKYDNIFQFGDVLELNCKVRLKFIKTNRESKIPMYDAKYPVESFLNKEQKLTGGVVVNNNWKPNESIEKLEKLTDVVKQRTCSKKDDNSLRKTQNIPHRTSKDVTSLDESIENFEKLTNAIKERIRSKKDDNSLRETQNIPHRTFKDVAGLDETVNLVKKQILYPMLYPKAFPDVTNCGTILYGPPGTGKTLLAQAIIGEAKERKDKTINFINIDGNSLESKYMGVTEAAWRKVFKEAVEKQPCILFIDEIDSVLSQRTGVDRSADKSKNAVVSQFLTLISDIEKNKHKVWIIGATNRPELIDSAIKRSGRIGNMIEVKKPDEKGCFQILNHYLKGKNVSDDFDRNIFAKQIHELGYTGADIANLVNSARDKMYERLGIYEQMENNTFVDRNLDDLQYVPSDFEKSLVK